MALMRRKGLFFTIVVAALMAAPTVASARHGHHHHHGHHHGHYGHFGHRHHWHGGGRWYGHHHHWGNRWNYGHWNHGHWGHRHYGYNSWYPRSYFSVGFGGLGWPSAYYSSYYSSYWRPSLYFQYTPRSYYYVPYSYGRSYYYAPYSYYGASASVPDSVLPLVGSGVSVRAGESGAVLPPAIAARTPRADSAVIADKGRDRAPIVRLAARTRPVDSAPVAIVPRTPVEHVSLEQNALRVMRSGDIAFQGQRYSNAAAFYEIATEQSPTDVKAHLRAGHALLAARRYHEAYRTFCRALTIDPGVVLSAVDLETLYVDPAEKDARLEALAKTALDNPTNAPLHALVGLYLVHDGQAQRAERFFAEAQRLTGGNEPLSARATSAPRHVASR